MRLDSIQWISHKSEQMNKTKNKSNSSHIRKFVLSSYRVYAGLISEIIISDENSNDIQSRSLQNRDQIIQEICLQNSILYRETFRTLLNDIDKVAEQLNILNEAFQLNSAENSNDEKEVQEIGEEGYYSKQINESIEYYEIIKNIEKTWHLCEILFLNPSSPMLSLELMRWLKGEHEALYLTQRLEDLLDNPTTTTAITRMTATVGMSGGSTATVESHIDYYPLLYDLTLHGKLETVYYLFTLHSRFAKLLHFYPTIAIELKRLLCHHPYAFYVDLELDVDTLISTLTNYNTNVNADGKNSTATATSPKKSNNRTPLSSLRRHQQHQQKSFGLQDDDDEDDDDGEINTAAAAHTSKAIKVKLNQLKYLAGTSSTSSNRSHTKQHQSSSTAATATQLSAMCHQWREDIHKCYQTIISATAASALSVPEIALVLEVLCGREDQALLQLVDCCSGSNNEDNRMDGDGNENNNTANCNDSNEKVIKYIMLQFLYKYTPPLHSQDLYHITAQAFATYSMDIHSKHSPTVNNNSNSETQLQLYSSQQQCTQSQQLLLSALKGDAAKIVKYVYEVMIIFQQEHYQQLKSIHIVTITNTNSGSISSNNSITLKYIDSNTSSNSVGSQITMTLLQSCVHLCDLLSRSGAATDFILPLPQHGKDNNNSSNRYGNKNSQSGNRNSSTAMIVSTTTTANTVLNPSFLEEVSLQLLEMLHELDYPTEIIQGYGSSHSCPVQGSAYVTALLSHRHCSRDSQALTLSSALEGYTTTHPLLALDADNDSVEQNAILAKRQKEITKRGLPITDTPAVVPLLVRASEWYQLGQRRGIIRSLYFYQLAHDHPRSQAILDRTFWSLCCAVRCCSSLFPGLILHPDQPSQPWKKALTTQQPTLKNKEMEKCRFLFTLTDLSVYWSQKYWPDFYVGSEEWNKKNDDILQQECKHNSHYPINVSTPTTASAAASASMSVDEPTTKSTSTNSNANNGNNNCQCDTNEFNSVLSFAQDILNSLRQSETKIVLSDYYNIALSLYTQAIVTLVKAMTTFDQLQIINDPTNITSNTTSSAQILTTDMMVLLELCLVCMDSFQTAGMLLYDLLTSQSVPMRYWLCILDLCTWIDARARVSLEYIRKLNLFISATAGVQTGQKTQTTHPHSFSHTATLGPTSTSTSTTAYSLHTPFSPGQIGAQIYHTANAANSKENSLYQHLQIRLQNHGACIYTKLQTFALSHTLKELETSYNNEFFLCFVSPEIELKSLKLKLLGMYTAAVLQENADQGYKAYQVLEKEREKQHNDYLATKHFQQQQIQKQQMHQQQAAGSSNKYPRFSFDC